MATPHQENHGNSRPRPRANTSFIAWRRNMPDSSTSASASLASSPAAPVQTLPIDTLVQFLTPPAVPSPQHARALVTALSTQTPAPSPDVLMPILSSICSVTAPPSLQAAGFDVLAAYCSCGAPLMTSDRLIYFEILQDASSAPWAPEIWEPRLKALNALMVSTEDAIGVEKQLLRMISGWIRQALDNYCSSESDRQERERPLEVLSEALIEWFERIEASGRLAEDEVISLFEFYQSLVDYVLKLPAETVHHSAPVTPTPTTPQRENSTNSTFYRHRRHPSSNANIPSPLSPHASTARQPQQRGPVDFISNIYLNFLTSRLTRLPLSFLPPLMPLLFRILSTVMSPLPALSPNITPRHPIEYRVIKTIGALLTGPYATTCLILLRQLLLPAPEGDVEAQIKTSLGAVRTLRQQIRRVLEDRMAMRAVQRGTATSTTHTGAPASMSTYDDANMLERAKRAWTKEGAAVWDARKVALFLVKAIRAWNESTLPADKECIFEEIAGLLKDVVQEMDDRACDRDFGTDKDFNDNDTGGAVGRTLYELMTYVKTLRNEDGSPVILSLSNAFTAPTPFLRILAEIFGHSQPISYLDPPVSVTLLCIVDHLSDADSERIPLLMAQQHQLKPTSSEWLENWDQLLQNPNLFIQTRPRTRQAMISALQSVFTLVRDMQGYRRPLMDSVFNFWTRLVSEKNEGGDGSAIWKLLGEEAALRAVEDDIEELFTPTDEAPPDMSGVTIHMILTALAAASTYCECDGEVEMSIKPADAPPISPMIPLTPSNTVVSSAGSPVFSRMASDTHVYTKEKEQGSNVHSQLMSLLTFGTSRHSSSSHVPQVSSPEEVLLSASPRNGIERQPPPGSSSSSPDSITVPNPCRGLTAATALIEVFAQLAFVDSVMTPRQSRLSIYVFGQIQRLLRAAQCPRVRIAVLQMLLRLRADRDHRVYLLRSPEVVDKQIFSLARLIGRLRDVSTNGVFTDDSRADEIFMERARAKQVFERDGRRMSRGRGSRTSGTGSRSRSRVPRPVQPITPVNFKPRDQLWAEPDIVPFSLDNSEKGSQILVTYDPLGPNDEIVLPVSEYMDAIVEILKAERDWEVLSYLLVHLPAQLANKHFWCGPMARSSISKLLLELCQSIKGNTFGKYISQEEWPTFSRTRDAIGLAYHTLTVLISYRLVLDPGKRKALVDIFQMGLSGRGDTVIVCTHALTLCAFEMETTIVKELPSILEKLTQIVSNPSMAVHILTFLCNLNSLPNIYSNFTDADFKLVFAVALQYLQHHNRLETSREMPFSLSQHVRIMSYSVLYMWFLSLKLADRPQHVKFIVRQLLLANNDEERIDVDVSTEVCFDLLARYTYANADPKPAPSLLGDILSTPAEGSANAEGVQEKTWVMGYSIVTVRLLAKAGWLEVTSRRASGTTKFLVKSENVPLVELGDVNPDLDTIPASLMMDKDSRLLRSILTPSELPFPPDLPPPAVDENGELLNDVFKSTQGPDEEEADARPDPVTGYVWTESAPSQRRKRVDLDPGFFPLQLSSYPDIRSQHRRGRIVKDTRKLGLTIRTLDRIPVIDTHKVGILYVAPGQTDETDILKNSRGSPAYTRFLEGIGRLIKLRSQLDVYTGGLDADEDGEYAYAWWDDTGQILYHTATMMPNHENDERCNFKKRHIGNDLVRIVWNDSGLLYRFDTLTTEFQFVNIVIEPHSRGAIAAYSNSLHENEFFKLTVQCAEGMAEFSPIGDFKIVSAKSLSILVRQLSIVADWYASMYKDTYRDTERNEIVTNWRARLEAIKKFASSVPSPYEDPPDEPGIMGQESFRDFTPGY